MIEKIEKKLRRFAIPNLTMYLVAGQAFFYLVTLAQANPEEFQMSMAFIPKHVLKGEVWRLLTFLMIPPTMNLIFIFFALYLFWLFGTSLEYEWGTFRYNLYLLVAYVASVAAAFIDLEGPATNTYIGTSVFLAFAFLYPEFELLLFFILPVKVKWLALLAWVMYAVAFLGGEWQTRMLILASISNFLLFFGRELVSRMRSKARRMAHETEQATEHDQPFHRCTKCGITDITHPQTEFRYCPSCQGSPGYCIEHIDDHEHV